MLKSLFDNVVEQSTKFVGKFKNKNFMQACMTASVMVAQADGIIEPSEKKKIFGYAAHNDLLKVFDFEDIKKEFEAFCGKYDFDPDLGKQDCMSSLSKLTKSMDPEQKKCIMMVSCAIGKADGNFDDKEKAIVREIRTALELKPEDFPI